MQFHEEDDIRIKRFLLGEVTAEETEQIEDRLFADPAFVQQLSVVEQELMDDYLCERLTAEERARFENHFLATQRQPEQTSLTDARREQLLLMKALKKYAAKTDQSFAVRASVPLAERAAWRQTIFANWWRAPLFAALMVLIGLLGWRSFVYQTPANQAMLALNRAYRTQRPLEARITGLNYAPFPLTLGTGQAEVDTRARNLAENILLVVTEQQASNAELHALGQVYLAKQDFAEAKKQFEAALATAPHNAQLHNDLGVAWFELGKSEQRQGQAAESEKSFAASIDHFSQALQLDSSLLAARFNLALLFQSLRLANQAQEEWRRYLEQDATSAWAEEARRYLKLLEDDAKKKAQSKEQTQQEFLRALAAKDEDGVLLALNRGYSALNEPLNGNYIIANLVDELLTAKLQGAQPAAAVRWQTLAELGQLLAQRTEDRLVADLARFYQTATPWQVQLVAQARQTAKEAFGHYRKATNDQAVALFEQARAMFTRAGDEPEALYAKAWIGHCHYQRSDTAQNLTVFTQLVPALHEKSYRWLEATARCGLANAHHSSGQFSRAVEDAWQCGRITEKIGDQVGHLRGLYMLGQYYYDLGQHDANLRLVRKGLELAYHIGAELNYAIVFYHLAGSSLRALGYFEPALAYQQEYLRMAEQRGSARLLARAHIFIGLTYGKWRWFEQAIASVQRGIEIGQKLANDETGQEFVHYGLMHLGHLYREAGRFAEALAIFAQVSQYAEQRRMQPYYYRAAKGRLLTLIAYGDKRAAQTELNKVLALYEENRNSIREESYRNSFFNQEQGIYDLAIVFAHDALNDRELALNYAERSRARSLLDAGRQEYELVEQRGTPILRFNDSKEPQTFAELKPRLPVQVQLLVYAVLRDKMIIWVIDQTGGQSRAVNLTADELNAHIERHLALITQPPTQPDERWRATASILYQVLIAPVEELLDRQKRLCVIADKQLHRLPFSTLFSPVAKKTLIEEYSLSYAASVNVFLRSTELARQKGGVVNERLLCVGNPDFDKRAFPGLQDLPSAEREVRHIASYYDSPSATVLIGSQAKKSAVLKGLAHADVAHLALHYLHDQRSPMLSRLPLAAERGEGQVTEAEALQLYELYKLKDLPARLAVLSACRTHAEEYYGGEGAIGIPRPLEAAGIPLVIASLWPVYALATSDLMIEFHRLRRGEGRTTVEALRAAQLAMLHNAGSYRHPYYWSAFIAVGGYSEY